MSINTSINQKPACVRVFTNLEPKSWSKMGTDTTVFHTVVESYYLTDGVKVPRLPHEMDFIKINSVWYYVYEDLSLVVIDTTLLAFINEKLNFSIM